MCIIGGHFVVLGEYRVVLGLIYPSSFLHIMNCLVLVALVSMP